MSKVGQSGSFRPSPEENREEQGLRILAKLIAHRLVKRRMESRRANKENSDVSFYGMTHEDLS
jgi:hypothetical protein